MTQRWLLALLLAPVVGCSGIVAAPGVCGDAAFLRKFRALTPESVRQVVTLKDDALETSATLTTERVLRDKRGLLGVVPYDVFLRAFIDKSSGATKYQVYIRYDYTAPIFAKFALVNYETPGGPRSERLRVLGRVRGSCSKYSGCARSETVAFMVEEKLLRALAAAYRPDKDSVWGFRIKALDGREVTDAVPSAEIAGLLLAVDAYRAAMPGRGG